MNTIFTVVVIVSVFLLACWLMIPIAVLMLDGEDVDQWNQENGR